MLISISHLSWRHQKRPSNTHLMVCVFTMYNHFGSHIENWGQIKHGETAGTIRLALFSLLFCLACCSFASGWYFIPNTSVLEWLSIAVVSLPAFCTSKVTRILRIKKRKSILFAQLNFLTLTWFSACSSEKICTFNHTHNHNISLTISVCLLKHMITTVKILTRVRSGGYKTFWALFIYRFLFSISNPHTFPVSQNTLNKYI